MLLAQTRFPVAVLVRASVLLGMNSDRGSGTGAEVETVAEYDMTKGPGAHLMQTGAYVALPWSNELRWTFSVGFKNRKGVPA